jgi:signal transduction histidine kinase
VERQHWETLLAGLHAEFQLREEELNLLHYIDQELLKDGRPGEDLFVTIVQRLGTMFGSHRTRILLKRGQFLENSYSTVESDVGNRVLAVDSLTNRCLTENGTINLGRVNPGLSNVRVDGSPERHSLLATPLRFRGKPIGVVSAESSEFDAFTESHANALVKVSAQASLALQRVQSSDMAQLFQDLDLLLFSDSTDSQVIIQTALDRIVAELGKQRLPFSGAQILFLRGSDSVRAAEELEIVYSTNRSDIGITVRVDQSISGRAVITRDTVVIGDVDQEDNYIRMLGSQIKSEIAVPIFVGNGSQVIGVLNVESEEPDVFGGFNEVAMASFADRVKTLLAFAKLRADVTEALEMRSSNELLIAVGDQASNMVHRLNNTVGAMRFRIKELQEDQAAGALTSEDLTESLAALLGLADRTLDMPRRVTSLLDRTEGWVDLNRCISAAVTDLPVSEGVDIELSLADDVTVPAPDNFDIVVQNLVQNAMDAMPDGGRVVVSSYIDRPAEVAAQRVCVKVTDTGTGITPENLARVFDLKFSTKSASKKGMGLGLWWVRNFIRRLGGDVSVESQVGEGTTFEVRLPMTAVPRTA